MFNATATDHHRRTSVPLAQSLWILLAGDLKDRKSNGTLGSMSPLGSRSQSGLWAKSC
jgi:hypothetical protein